MMNLTTDILKLGERLDKRRFNEAESFEIKIINNEVIISNQSTLMLFSFQESKKEISTDKPEQGYLRIFGCDAKFTEIYRKCINFRSLINTNDNFSYKLLVKVRILEGNSFEAINKGINKLLEINNVPMLYFPDIKVYSMNEYILRDPSKNEINGFFIVAKAKGIIIYAELIDGEVNLETIKNCVNDKLVDKVEVINEKNKKIKR